MPDLPVIPPVPGVRHAEHDLPTGVRVHVAEAGDPEAPPLLLVHGWPQHWWAWRGVIPALARTHRVICPDLRGFGWSGQPADDDFRKERLADDQLAAHCAAGLDVEVVPGTHFLLDEQPGLVADRAAAWFA